jgi:hypothetical protein
MCDEFFIVVQVLLIEKYDIDPARFPRTSEVDNLMMYGGMNGTQEIVGAESTIYVGI